MKKPILFFFPAMILALFLGGNLFAVVPIQGVTLRGEAAYNARYRLLAAAEAYLGTPYRYAGVSRAGVDCSGLVFLSFRDALDTQPPRTTVSLYAWAEKIDTADLRVGDLVFFITDGQTVSHVGIYAGGRRFIHSASEGPRTGVMYSTLDEAYWRRTYTGAGRALPWDAEAEAAFIAGQVPDAPMAGGGNGADAVYDGGGYADKGGMPRTVSPPLKWASDHGVFTGFGLSWTFGGFIEGAPSVFRGLAGQAKIGYKWDTFRIALEVRPQWDRGLGVFHLPLDICLGTDTFQIFAGPAFTFGKPELDTEGGRTYYQSFAWLGELGLAMALPPIRIASGALSFFAELAWQPFSAEEGQGSNWKANVTANMRLSAGVRYLWLLI
ncbi:C40 family peptidase [Leadbettera azotonutricia]|uniref:Lipoprotein n=1 Tax=Leadbettera azotonutricia (strain ATCC BAA-888 / DSM 13862 / ZAS-9) TaxID=545695 RepID=F5YDW8_LEAAZ|nr:C40 family peptidase [Leadbettera azotonutricia]AEF81494.1 lipoprotein [Leadbettera azotonutricia ZAS-9]